MVKDEGKRKWGGRGCAQGPGKADLRTFISKPSNRKFGDPLRLLITAIVRKRKAAIRVGS